jgi:hypothetical protein
MPAEVGATGSDFAVEVQQTAQQTQKSNDK